MNVEERFWTKADQRGGPDACWLWTGALSERGYGKFGLAGRCRRAHRVAWEMTHGPIPEGLVVLHGCDNPPCVNPAHLSLGTQAENLAEMRAKGRHSPPPSGAKLTQAQVREIRVRLAAGDLHRVIAEAFGIAECTVTHIKVGRAWGWLK